MGRGGMSVGEAIVRLLFGLGFLCLGAAGYTLLFIDQSTGKAAALLLIAVGLIWTAEYIGEQL